MCGGGARRSHNNIWVGFAPSEHKGGAHDFGKMFCTKYNFLFKFFTPSPGISSVPVPVSVWVCAAVGSIFNFYAMSRCQSCLRFAFIDVPVSGRDVRCGALPGSFELNPCYGGQKESDLKDRPITPWDPP